jgi:hypothetical protein
MLPVVVQLAQLLAALIAVAVGVSTLARRYRRRK